MCFGQYLQWNVYAASLASSSDSQLFLRTAALFCRSRSLSALIFICSALSDLRFSWYQRSVEKKKKRDHIHCRKVWLNMGHVQEGDMSIQCDLWGWGALLLPSYASRSGLQSEFGAPSGPFPFVFDECPENISGRSDVWAETLSNNLGKKKVCRGLPNPHQNPLFLPLGFWELPSRPWNQAWGLTQKMRLINRSM